MRQKQDERLQFRNTEVVNRSRVEDGNSNRDPSPAGLARKPTATMTMQR